MINSMHPFLAGKLHLPTKFWVDLFVCLFACLFLLCARSTQKQICLPPISNSIIILDLYAMQYVCIQDSQLKPYCIGLCMLLKLI